MITNIKRHYSESRNQKHWMSQCYVNDNGLLKIIFIKSLIELT